MGLFKKKHDPIAERAEALSQQIAALEAEIQGLAARRESAVPAAAPSPAAPAPAAPAPADAAAEPSRPRPRVRSVTKPPSSSPSPFAAPAPAPRAQEPIFEEVDHARLQAQQEQATSGHFNELGVRKYDLAAVWRRTRSHFRGPATTNPKLVNYLAAGSIQGLRPMRYEKRVARNRFIFLVVVLALVMWGLIWIFMKGTR